MIIDNLRGRILPPFSPVSSTFNRSKRLRPPLRFSPVSVVLVSVLLSVFIGSISATDGVGDPGYDPNDLDNDPKTSPLIDLSDAVRESVRLATSSPVKGGRQNGDADDALVSDKTMAPAVTPTTTTTTTTTTKTTTTTASTTTTTKSPVKTLGPSRDVEYKMVLSSSGPAVLDSAVWFSVELVPQVGNASVANWTTQFIYQWMNMANKAMNRTEDLRVSRISMTFFSNKVKAGNYPMTVAAFLKDNPARLVAFQTQIFVLTERLNGQLVLYQDLTYQRFPNVFATNQELSLRAQVHDRFHKSPKPTFEFFWYKGGKFIKSTNKPFIDTRVLEPTNITVKSVIFLSFSDDGRWNSILPSYRQKLLGRKSAGGSESKSELRSKGDMFESDLNHARNSEIFPLDDSSPAVTGDLALIEEQDQTDNLPLKKGKFDAPALFKDALTACTVDRVDKKGFAIETEESATVEVSCLGSPPLAVCLNVTKQNHTIGPTNACLPVEFHNDTNHKVRVFLNASGWQDVHFYIYNDVSRVAVVQSFYGYTQDSTNILPLTLPIVFGVLGLIVVVVGGVYIMRLRKKPLVEVADFDFHPMLTSRLRDSNSITLSRMFNSLRYFLFARDKSKDEINFPAELSPTPTEFSPTPTDFSRTPLSESFKSETEAVLYGSL